MFTKMVLPRLGGAPTVWSVAMVFFQAALLAGYAYAHLLVRTLPLGLGALVHLGVLAAAAATLPIGDRARFRRAAHDRRRALARRPVRGLDRAALRRAVGERAAAAGLVRATGHPHARNPYVLYAASNLGSFAALIAYPFVIEPLLPLKAQAQALVGGLRRARRR